MRTVPQYLDLLKTALAVDTDYKLGKKLDFSRSRVSNYRTGDTFFDNETCARVAEVLRLDPMEVIADMEMQRAKTPEKKAFWQHVIDALTTGPRRTILSVLVLVFSMGISGLEQAGGGVCVLCKIVNRSFRDLLQRVRARFQLQGLFNNNNNQGANHDCTRHTALTAPGSLSRLQLQNRFVTGGGGRPLRAAPEKRETLGDGQRSGPAGLGCVPVSRGPYLRVCEVSNHTRGRLDNPNWQLAFRGHRAIWIPNLSTAGSRRGVGSGHKNAAGILTAAFLAVLLASGSADAEPGLSVGCCSWHSEPLQFRDVDTGRIRTEPWNEINPGITYESGFHDSVFIGVLKDSHSKLQKHAGVIRRWTIREGIHAGLVLGLADREFEGRILPIVAPTLTLGGERYAVQAMLIPGAGRDTTDVVHISFRLGL